MFFFIDNPTNIYLCSIFGITFVDYAIKMFLPTILAGTTAVLITFLIFRKKLLMPFNVSIEEIKKPDKTFLTIGLVGLFSSILLMALSSYISLQLWYIPLIFVILTYLAEFIAIKTKKSDEKLISNSIKKLPFAIIPFLLSMSIIVEALNHVGFIKILADFLSTKSVFFVGILSFVCGNLFNNIPMSMLFAGVLSNFATTLNNVYAVVIASNVCAFLTPVGALAGIMFMNILKNNNVKLSFKKFIGYGILTSIPTLLIALLIIFLI